jgi:hypothetical protein
MPRRASPKTARSDAETATGHCLCGAVEIEIDVPAFWAWHDWSRATQTAHGAAYATYVGCWRKKLRVVKGADAIATFAPKDRKSERSFCKHCGTPLFYARNRSAKMINIPRALFAGRTGREPRYHVGITDAPEWAYAQEHLKPLKGYPGVLVVRNVRLKRAARDPFG